MIFIFNHHFWYSAHSFSQEKYKLVNKLITLALKNNLSQVKVATGHFGQKQNQIKFILICIIEETYETKINVHWLRNHLNLKNLNCVFSFPLVNFASLRLFFFLIVSFLFSVWIFVIRNSHYLHARFKFSSLLLFYDHHNVSAIVRQSFIAK